MLIKTAKNLSPLEAERLRDPPDLPRCFAFPPSVPPAAAGPSGSSPTRRSGAGGSPQAHSHPASFSLSPSLAGSSSASVFVDLSGSPHSRHAPSAGHSHPVRFASSPVIPYSPFVIEKVYLDVEVLADGAAAEQAAEIPRSRRGRRQIREEAPALGDARNGPGGEAELGEGAGSETGQAIGLHNRDEDEPPAAITEDGGAPSLREGDEATGASHGLPPSSSPSESPSPPASPPSGESSAGGAAGACARRRTRQKAAGGDKAKADIGEISSALLNFHPQVRQHYPLLANADARIYQFVQRRAIRKTDGCLLASSVTIGEGEGGAGLHTFLYEKHEEFPPSISRRRRETLTRCIPNAISLPNLSRAASVLAALDTAHSWRAPGTHSRDNGTGGRESGKAELEAEPSLLGSPAAAARRRDMEGATREPDAPRFREAASGRQCQVAGEAGQPPVSLDERASAYQSSGPLEMLAAAELRLVDAERGGAGRREEIGASARGIRVEWGKSYASSIGSASSVSPSARAHPSAASSPSSFFPAVLPARTEKQLLPPLRLGVVVGGAAPSSGVHNVIVGLFHFLRDFTQAVCPECALRRCGGGGRPEDRGEGERAREDDGRPRWGGQQGPEDAPPRRSTMRPSPSVPSELARRGWRREGERLATERREQSRGSPAHGDVPSGSAEEAKLPRDQHARRGRVDLPRVHAGSKVRDEAGSRASESGGGKGCCRCSKLIGFLDGALGLAKDESVELTEEVVGACLNMGGCELLGYRAFKTLTDFSISRIQQVCEKHQLHGLVIVGGAEDLQAATQLAHRFLQEGLRTRIVAVPHSARGDLHCREFLPITLGFDSARRMLSEFCGNIALDSSSSKKYYHFVRCSSSNLTLECALQTRPTMCLTGLECDVEGWTLERIIEAVCDVIVKRRQLLGKRSGTILLSEELVENLPEMADLRDAIQGLLQPGGLAAASPYSSSPGGSAATRLGSSSGAGMAGPACALQPSTEESISALLPPPLARAFRLLPAHARRSLLLQHDCKGRPLLPTIEAEALIAQRVEKELRRRKAAGDSRCVETFTYRLHYLGQEGRCPLPTRFDCSLGYALGTIAGASVAFGLTGYMACVRNVHRPLDCWDACALPLVCLLRPSPRVPSDVAATVGPSLFHPPPRGEPARREGEGDGGGEAREAGSGGEGEGPRLHPVAQTRHLSGSLHERPLEHRDSQGTFFHPSHHQPLAVPTIPPYRLEAHSNLFRCYRRVKNSWKVYCLYRSPGPVSFAPTPRLTLTLCPACHRYASFCVCADEAPTSSASSLAGAVPFSSSYSSYAMLAAPREARSQAPPAPGTVGAPSEASRASLSPAESEGDVAREPQSPRDVVEGGQGLEDEEARRRERQMLMRTEVDDGSIPLMLVAQFCSPIETLLHVQPLKLRNSKFTALFAQPDAEEDKHVGGKEGEGGDEVHPGTSAERKGEEGGDASTETMRKKSSSEEGETRSEDTAFADEDEIYAWTDSEEEEEEEREFPLEPPHLFLNCRRRCQLSYFQLCRLDYKPKLPAVFFQPFTLAGMDITAVISSNPALVQRIFPLTHNLRAIDIVPLQQLTDADPWTAAPLPPSSFLFRFWRSPRAAAPDSSPSPESAPEPCLPRRGGVGARDRRSRASCRGTFSSSQQSLSGDEPGAAAGRPGGDPPACAAACASGGDAKNGRSGGLRKGERVSRPRSGPGNPSSDDGGDEKASSPHTEASQAASSGVGAGLTASAGGGEEGAGGPCEHKPQSLPPSRPPGFAAEALRSSATSPSRRVHGGLEAAREEMRRGDEKQLAAPPQFVGVHGGGLALRADADLEGALQFDAHDASSPSSLFAANPMDCSAGSPSFLPVPLRQEEERPHRVSPYPASFPPPSFVSPLSPSRPVPPAAEPAAEAAASPRRRAARTRGGDESLEARPPQPPGAGGARNSSQTSPNIFLSWPAGGATESTRQPGAAGPAGALEDWQSVASSPDAPPAPTMARIISPSVVGFPASEGLQIQPKGPFDARRRGLPCGLGRAETLAQPGEAAPPRDCEGERRAGRGDPGGGEKEGQDTGSACTLRGCGVENARGDRQRLHPPGLLRGSSAPQRDFPRVGEEDALRPSHLISSHSSGHPPPQSGAPEGRSAAQALGVGRAGARVSAAETGLGGASSFLSGSALGRVSAAGEVPFPRSVGAEASARARSDPTLPKGYTFLSPARVDAPLARVRRRTIGVVEEDRSALGSVDREAEAPSFSGAPGAARSSALRALLGEGAMGATTAAAGLRSSGAPGGPMRRNTQIEIRSSASPVVMLRYEPGGAEGSRSLQRGAGSTGRRWSSVDDEDDSRPTSESRGRSLSPSHHFRLTSDQTSRPAGGRKLSDDSGRGPSPHSASGSGARQSLYSSAFASARATAASSAPGAESPRLRGCEASEGDRERSIQARGGEGETGRRRREAGMTAAFSAAATGSGRDAEKRAAASAAGAVRGANELKLCLSRKSSRINLVESQEPLRVAVCFFGRQAPGGLNAVMGVLEYLENLTPKGECIGILGGILGLVNGWYTLVDKESFALFRNQGGLDLLCRTTEHFSNEFELEQCIKTIKSLRLDGLVVLGGTSAVSDAAILTEYLLDSDCQTCVVGIPMTVDNGMPFIEACLGHDTVCRVFNSIIGSLMSESRSSKCWYFIRVSGKCLSHLTAECALDTHPNLVLINEEIEQKRMGAMALTNLISDIVETRAGLGLHYGTVLLPDSLLAHLPEMHMLINEVDACFESGFYAQTEEGLELLRSRLTPWSAALFSSLPKGIQWQLAFNKDQTYRVDLTAIDTEVLLKRLVERELARRKSIGAFRKGQFLCKTHFLAYQGRSAAPTNFDADLGFSYGYTAAVLVDGGCTGYMAQISNLVRVPAEWTVSAVPFTCLVDVQPVKPASVFPLVQKPRARHTHRHHAATAHRQHNVASGHRHDVATGSAVRGHELGAPDAGAHAAPASSSGGSPSAVNLMFRVEVPLQKLSLQGGMFRTLALLRADWALGDCFSNPGPVQYEGAASLVRLNSLRMPSTDPTVKLKKISQLCGQVKSLCSVMATPPVLKTAESALHSLVEMLSTLSRSERNQQLQFYDISHVLAQRFTTKLATSHLVLSLVRVVSCGRSRPALSPARSGRCRVRICRLGFRRRSGCRSPTRRPRGFLRCQPRRRLRTFTGTGAHRDLGPLRRTRFFASPGEAASSAFFAGPPAAAATAASQPQSFLSSYECGFLPPALAGADFGAAALWGAQERGERWQPLPRHPPAGRHDPRGSAFDARLFTGERPGALSAVFSSSARASRARLEGGGRGRDADEAAEAAERREHDEAEARSSDDGDADARASRSAHSEGARRASLRQGLERMETLLSGEGASAKRLPSLSLVCLDIESSDYAAQHFQEGR
ncbi:hypothetical protein BESB_030930 [Besnoitia besnoiti]|uniref:Phosphofructokinase domain-containing protein n=1 Tax=Besnoitia besnoiti TaxID=94643 RepID=A0A2A9LZR7_BESBE|nr:hypothetical protein BESB_030930 [Besnoitia besnoiti]PFH31219.1 hypothetical protein BESB_030930 [Besnoitia besnoiti]